MCVWELMCIKCVKILKAALIIQAFMCVAHMCSIIVRVPIGINQVCPEFNSMVRQCVLCKLLCASSSIRMSFCSKFNDNVIDLLSCGCWFQRFESIFGIVGNILTTSFIYIFSVERINKICVSPKVIHSKVPNQAVFPYKQKSLSARESLT